MYILGSAITDAVHHESGMRGMNLYRIDATSTRTFGHPSDDMHVNCVCMESHLYRLKSVVKRFTEHFGRRLPERMILLVYCALFELDTYFYHNIRSKKASVQF